MEKMKFALIIHPTVDREEYPTRPKFEVELIGMESSVLWKAKRVNGKIVEHRTAHLSPDKDGLDIFVTEETFHARIFYPNDPSVSYDLLWKSFDEIPTLVKEEGTKSRKIRTPFEPDKIEDEDKDLSLMGVHWTTDKLWIEFIYWEEKKQKDIWGI